MVRILKLQGLKQSMRLWRVLLYSLKEEDNETGALLTGYLEGGIRWTRVP